MIFLRKIYLIILFSIYFLIISLNHCYSQNNYYSSLNNVKLRPIALGGAFTSINDDLAAAFYNPASLNLYKNDKKFKLTFFLNPLLSGLTYCRYTDKFQRKIYSRGILNSASLLPDNFCSLKSV